MHRGDQVGEPSFPYFDILMPTHINSIEMNPRSLKEQITVASERFIVM